MGCCSSRSSDSPASRVTRWRSTGIVALRDARLKEVPNEVLQVGNSLRTLDLTNNKLVEIPQEIGRHVNMQRLVRVSIIRSHHIYYLLQMYTERMVLPSNVSLSFALWLFGVNYFVLFCFCRFWLVI